MADSTMTLPTLDDLLEASSVSAGFAEATRHLESSHKFSDRIAGSAGSPPVKVLRTVMQLLEAEPGLAVEKVAVEGRSGCSDFRGKMVATLADGSTVEFRFVWDCAWKAEQVGWKSFFGDPDQQRAAREFGFRCFEVFERVG